MDYRTRDRTFCPMCFRSRTIVYHRAGMPDVTGLTGMRQLLEMSRSTIGDMRGTIEDLVARAIKSRAVGLVASLTEARSWARRDW